MQIFQYLNKKQPFDFISTTHELLYSGIESNIVICDDITKYGYYQNIWIICENINENIETLGMTNTDITLFKDIPMQIMSLNSNSFEYNLKLGDFFLSGIKINYENPLEIILRKKPDIEIKIYGTKLMILKENFDNL